MTGNEKGEERMEELDYEEVVLPEEGDIPVEKLMEAGCVAEDARRALAEEQSAKGAIPIKVAGGPVRMNLAEALALVLHHKSVCREGWEDKVHHIRLMPDKAMGTEILSLHKSDGPHAWIISVEDMMAEDWMTWKLTVAEPRGNQPKPED